METISPKSITVSLSGKTIKLYNQRSSLWTHPYPYHQDTATLYTSGCGIFAVCHCLQWMCGCAPLPEDLADFAVRYGGRGDDGTDRPALLNAMSKFGLAKQYGMCVPEPQLMNDIPRLLMHLEKDQGTALCNLRVGHIVSLLALRYGSDGQPEVLCADSNSESTDSRIAPLITETLTESRITTKILDACNRICGEMNTFMLYWCHTGSIKDYNLLEKTCF